MAEKREKYAGSGNVTSALPSSVRPVSALPICQMPTMSERMTASCAVPSGARSSASPQLGLPLTAAGGGVGLLGDLPTRPSAAGRGR